MKMVKRSGVTHVILDPSPGLDVKRAKYARIETMSDAMRAGEAAEAS